MISSVPKKYRAFGNSTAQIFLNLFGFLPAPFLYGLICQLTGGRDSQWGMVLIMFWSIFGLGTVSLAYFHDKAKRKRKEVNEILKAKEKEEKNKEQRLYFENNKTQSLCVKSERKLTGPNEKSFENRLHMSADAGKKSFNLSMGLQKSILNSFDFSQIHNKNNRKESSIEIQNDL